MISYLYGQDPSTTRRDFNHIAVLVVERLHRDHLSPLQPGSAEYIAKKGSGAFRHFPNAVMAIDVVKVRCRRPFSIDHGLYFDGHKREYNFGFLCGR